MKIRYPFLIVTLSFLACTETTDQAGNSNNDLSIQQDSASIQVENEIVNSEDLPQRMIEQADLILGQSEGDLDNDGIAEKVVVFARDLEFESSSPRDLVIYKNNNGVWEEWISTENAVYMADEGGMMGDPFDGVSINNGILEIDHFGGSSWKWSNRDKYRYQDGDFYLIGYTSTYGRPCDYWEDYDVNLSTGDCIFSFEPEVCEDYEPEEDYGPAWDEKFNYPIKKLPKLTERRSFSLQFNSPKGKTFYL